MRKRKIWQLQKCDREYAAGIAADLGGFACGGQRVAEPGRQGKRRDQRIFVRQRTAVS